MLIHTKSTRTIKVNRGTDGIVSTLYAVYDVLDNTDGRFIEYYFANKDRINRYLKPIVRIGAKHDMKIGNEEVLLNTIKIPSYYEQKRVSDFLDIISKRQQIAKCLTKSSNQCLMKS